MKSEGVKKLLEDLVVKKHVPCFTVHVKATSFLATWKRRIHSIYGVVIIKIKRTNVIAHEVCYFADAGCPTKVFHQIQSLPIAEPLQVNGEPADKQYQPYKVLTLMLSVISPQKNEDYFN